MKKSKITASILMVLMMMMFALPAAASAAPASVITVAVNGKLVDFPDQKPYIDSANRTLVPVRFPAEVLGADVGWVQSSQTVTIKHAGDAMLPKTNISLKIGQKNVLVNGATKTMDTTAVISNNRTMVPVRFISEYMGADVAWWDASHTVHVFTKDQSKKEQQQIMEQVAKELIAEVTGQKIMHSDQLEEIYGIFKTKGFKVGLRSFSDCINDYGVIEVYSNKSAPNKDQFDQDVYEQVKAYIGTDAAEWVKKILDACEDPEVSVVNLTRVFGDKAVAVYMYDMQYDAMTNSMETSDKIVVEFSDMKELGR